MRKWHTLLNIFQFPLKLLFIASILFCTGTLLLNPNFTLFFPINGDLIYQVAYFIRTIGNFIIVNFPFFILVKMLSRKGAQGIQSEVGLIGYFVFLITTMYFSTQALDPIFYRSVFGISLSTTNIPGINGAIQYPIQTGLFGVLSAGLLARWSYRKSRNKNQYGLFAFIDKNTYAIILILCGSIILGLLYSILWPIVLQGLNEVFEFIASDINNPMHLFIYGILDRFLSVFNLGGIIRNAFWFSEMGGSWIDITGIGYTGDVSIWMAQVAQGTLPIGYGRFITPYYIINLFAVPGMLIALYSLYTDKMERKRYRIFFFMAILLSLLGGTLLPLEIFLLIMAPMLFIGHLIITGFLFATCQAMSIYFGFSFTGNAIAAMPGNIFDILVYVRNPEAYTTIMTIAIIGVIVFMLYFALTQIYYRSLALNLFNTVQTKKVVDGFVMATGGLDNIKRINSSIFRVVIQIDDASLINFDQLHRLGATKVVEVRAGFAIFFGASSTIIKKEVSRKMKDAKRKVD